MAPDRLSTRERNMLTPRQRAILTRTRTAAAAAELRSQAEREAWVRDCLPLARERVARFWREKTDGVADQDRAEGYRVAQSWWERSRDADSCEHELHLPGAP